MALLLGAPRSDAATNPSDQVSPTAIRERIAKVVETYSVPTFAFPEPMSADEAAAALALNEDDFERLEPLLVFARRWGVCLDWLIAGDVGALLLDGRRSRERDRREDAAVADDPAVVAYRAYRAEWERVRPVIDRAAHLHPDDPDGAEVYAAEAAAVDGSLTLAERAASVDAETLEGLRCQLLLVGDMGWGLLEGGDPDSLASYVCGTDLCVGEAVERKALLSVYAAIARWIDHPSGEAAVEARSAITVEGA
ncbi:MAG: hypothetical protein AAF526_01800 [Pseudomonadota bacterium]